MYEYTPEAIRRTLLFHSWHEASELWRRLVEALPEPRTLVMMPDGIHMLHDEWAPERLRRAMGDYAQWRNRSRKQRGRVWDPLEAPVRVKDPSHARRKHRYHLLNPCRDQLTPDPLGWPFSTYADDIGWTLAPVRPAVEDRDAHACWVRRDDTVDLTWPVTPPWPPTPPTLERLVGATSWLFRIPVSEVQRPESRAALVTAARRCNHRLVDIASVLGLSTSTVKRAPEVSPAAVAMIVKSAGDARFAALDPLDRRPTWRRYRWKR